MCLLSPHHLPLGPAKPVSVLSQADFAKLFYHQQALSLRGGLSPFPLSSDSEELSELRAELVRVIALE